MIEGQHALEHSGTVYPLGKYIVLAELGRGGMAEVYLALSRGPSGFSKLVVLKLLRAHLAEDDEFLRMFLAEARLAARLNHANIVQTYEIGLEGGRSCIVMEYLEGRSLSEVDAAAKQRTMPLSLGVRVIADVLAGLHYAHERCDVHGQPLGLVHRDVSPHNVFVTYDGQVKLLDFGIAKAADDGGHTKTGIFKGKLRYTAPERFRGEDSDRRSDIFSVGAMLWQMLAKRPLWQGMTELALMQHLANRTPIPSPRTVDPEIPARLEEICMKAVAMSADERFQTAAEMQDALEEFLAGESAGVTSRALGKFMIEVFGPIRARFQRTVDEQLRAAANLPLDAEVGISIARVRAQGVPLLGSDELSNSLSSIPLPSSASRVRAGMVSPTSVGTFELTPYSDAMAEVPSRRPRRWVGPAMVALLFAGLSTLLLVHLRADRASNPGGDSVSGVMPGAASGGAKTTAGTAVGAPVSAGAGALLTPSSTDTADPASPASAPSDATGALADPPRAVAPATRRPLPTGVGPWHTPTTRARASAPAVEAHTATASPEAEPPKREVDCASPYFIDDQGMKKIRPECL